MEVVQPQAERPPAQLDEHLDEARGIPRGRGLRARGVGLFAGSSSASMVGGTVWVGMVSRSMVGGTVGFSEGQVAPHPGVNQHREAVALHSPKAAFT